jgi:hypothetical protein
MKKYFAIILTVLSLSACDTTGTARSAPFTVWANSPRIEVGFAEGNLDRLLGVAGLRKAEITVEYFPVEDAVCLKYRHDLITYQQFWSRRGREAFIKGLEQYKYNYDQRTLKNRGSRQTKKAYGTAEGYLIWQMVSFTTMAMAPVEVQIGYFMRNVSGNRVAFFTLNQKTAEYIPEMVKTEVRSTQEIPMFLTRTQAETIAAFFDQELLDSLVVESPVFMENVPPSYDTY